MYTKQGHKDVHWTHWQLHVPFLHSTLVNWLTQENWSFPIRNNTKNKLNSFPLCTFSSWLNEKYSSFSGLTSYNPCIFPRKYLILQYRVLILKVDRLSHPCIEAVSKFQNFWNFKVLKILLKVNNVICHRNKVIEIRFSSKFICTNLLQNLEVK